MTISWKEVTGEDSEVMGRAKVITMYAIDMMSLREIESHLGKAKVTTRTIARMMVAWGVKMRPKGGRYYVKDMHIPEEEYLNLTYKELCKKYGISTVTVRRLTKHYKPKPRPGRQPRYIGYGDDPIDELKGPRR